MYWEWTNRLISRRLCFEDVAGCRDHPHRRRRFRNWAIALPSKRGLGSEVRHCITIWISRGRSEHDAVGAKPLQIFFGSKYRPKARQKLTGNKGSDNFSTVALDRWHILHYCPSDNGIHLTFPVRWLILPPSIFVILRVVCPKEKECKCVSNIEQDDSIDLNGIVLLSSDLNFDTEIDQANLNPGVNLPYALALWAEADWMFQGSSSSMRLMGWSAMRVSTWRR
jgi:hypothetical protein